jgi:hypothetical protein
MGYWKWLYKAIVDALHHAIILSLLICFTMTGGAIIFDNIFIAVPSIPIIILLLTYEEYKNNMETE